MSRDTAAIPLPSALCASPAPAAFASVEVSSDPAAVLDAWATLESEAPCSIYQTRSWLLPWLETLGRLARLAPMFVVARDAAGVPVALLCLGVARRGPFRLATFLGGKDANFNLPLTRRDVGWTAREVRRLLEQAAAGMGRDAPDVFVLSNQPFAWGRAANPFALLPHRASPSAAYGTALPREAEALFADKLSKETRKKLRKKEAKLTALGPVTHRVATTAVEAEDILDAFIAQKLARFRERGIVSQFDAPEMRAFLEAAAAPCGTGIELHALMAGERIVATYGGATHDGQWSGMFNSFDADDEIAKASPGDLLLMRIIAKACDDGLRRFDLGIGEARYKAALCDETLPLFDCIVPQNPRGALYGALVGARQQAKRVVKRHPRLMALVRKVRVLRG